MCFSLVSASLSICPSRRWISGALPHYSPTATSLPHPGNRGWNRYGPQTWQEPAGRA